MHVRLLHLGNSGGCLRYDRGENEARRTPNGMNALKVRMRGHQLTRFGRIPLHTARRVYSDIAAQAIPTAMNVFQAD